MTITPIETRYAGCRFRSRLEARWAVFFDALGVEWRYEPQGYVVGGRPYLPDFWLPSSKVWVEVKGVLDEAGLDLLVRAASADGLPRRYGSDLQVALDDQRSWGKRILILGDIPSLEPGDVQQHTVMVYAAGYVFGGYRHFLGNGNLSRDTIDVLPEQLNPEIVRDSTLRFDLKVPFDYHRVEDAYVAARTARFEHGERPTAVGDAS